MATGKRPPSGSPGGRRRRPASTIDLKATEIASHPVAPEERAEAPTAEPASAPQAEAAFRPPEPPRHDPYPPRHDPEPPRHDPFPQPPDPPPRGSGPPREPGPRFARPSIAWLPPDVPWPLIGAGAVGAAMLLLPLLLLWLAGAWSTPPDPASVLQPRLAAIEAQLRELAARPQPPSIDPKSIDELAARLGKLEAAVAAPRPPQTDPAVLERLAASESATKALVDQMAALSQRVIDTAQQANDAAAAARDARTHADSAIATAIDSHSNTRAAAAGSDRAVRLALLASALRAAVERGDPFAAELASVKQLGADAGALAPLEPFAASGLPDNATLGRELSALIAPMLRAVSPAQRNGGFLDRLQANAERLVRIRPVDEAPGDDPMAVLARIESKAAQADIAGALAEFAKLAPAVRAPAESWIVKAQSRSKAIETSRRLAADAIAGLRAAP